MTQEVRARAAQRIQLRRIDFCTPFPESIFRFGFEIAAHQVLNRFGGLSVVEQNIVNGVDDGKFHVDRIRQGFGAFAGGNTFGDHFHVTEDLGEGFTLANAFANITVAAVL